MKNFDANAVEARLRNDLKKVADNAAAAGTNKGRNTHND